MAGYCINVHGWGAEFGGWHKKDGQAAEFKDAGHNYRLWKPSSAAMSPNPWKGMSVAYKMDHIKGFPLTDKHCYVLAEFGKRGELKAAHISGGKNGNKFKIKVTAKGTEVELDLDQAWRSVFPDNSGDYHFKNVVKISILKLKTHVLA